MSRNEIGFDRSKLHGRIIEKYGTQKDFAVSMGKSDAYVSRVMKGKALLDDKEIIQWALALDIPHNEVPAYFLRLNIDI